MIDRFLDGSLAGVDDLLGDLTADGERTLADYEGAAPRWCPSCGDNTVLTALLRLCRDERLAPEDTVFVSGIGCASRLPHYVRAYGFHSLHGRALPVAEGIKLARPELTVFVTTGDGDCCSIGTAHWIHALRYNMDLTVLVHDNGIYGLTKKQVSPTSPRGLATRTSPRGAWLEALNPLTVTLGVPNVSFVAQVADWRPELLGPVLRAAHRHRGLSFVRVLQRCPNFVPDLWDEVIADPSRTIELVPPGGEAVGAGPARPHDAGDRVAAFAVALDTATVPLGVLFQDDAVPCYEDLRRPAVAHTAERVRAVVERELDRFTVPVALG